MKKHLAVALTLALALVALAALARGITGWAQGPEGDSSRGSGTGSADMPGGVEFTGPPDTPPGLTAEGIEAAASYNASLRIVGSVLRPRVSNVEWDTNSDGGCIYASSGISKTWFNAPIYLPQGSTIKYLRMYYKDLSITYDSEAWFTVYDMYGLIVDEWNVDSTGNSGTGYATSSEFTHTVNYDNYSYAVNWRPNYAGNMEQLCGLRLFYQTPPGYSYLPLAVKGE